MSIVLLLRRAFVSNLRNLTAGEDERATLARAGIDEPTIQGYFAWRRSLVAMVVLTTVLSAGLATFRELTETDEQVTLFDNISTKLLESAEEAIPSGEMSEEDADDPAAALEAVKRQLATTAVVATVEEQLTERAAAEEDEEAEEEPEPNALGKFADLLDIAAMYALAASAALAFVTWTRFRFSFRVLLAGFVFSFFVPMIVALCPWSWWGYDDATVDFRQDPEQFIADMAESLLYAAEYMITLLPTVLSLIPGVQRACLRIKTLLPESLLPGWYLVAAAPLYGLFLLVIFVGINQVASDPIFLIGMFLFLAAPAMYVVRADVFTGPLATDADFQRMRNVQKIIAGITVAAALLLVYYLTTQNVMGVRVVGLDAKSSLLQPLDLVEFVLEFLARSMFMTVFGADLFMRMNLTSWQHNRTFLGTPAAARYDGVMTALADATK
ncbi:MAG: hypothetical protein SH850_08360 [Planctomycetaceae bacterium]|nr:hypothetical protein [Planctomycetaceae bacterium]